VLNLSELNLKWLIILMVEASVYSSLPDPFKDRQVSEKQCPSLIN